MCLIHDEMESMMGSSKWSASSSAAACRHPVLESPDGCTLTSATGDEMLRFWNVFGTPEEPKPAKVTAQGLQSKGEPTVVGFRADQIRPVVGEKILLVLLYCSEKRFEGEDRIAGGLSLKKVATTLTGLHFATTTFMTVVLRWLGYVQPSHLPLSELLKFVLFANLSVVGMNVSLMWNSVGFYQIAKLCMIPVSCLLEVILDKIRYSRDTKHSILVVQIDMVGFLIDI